MVRGDVPFKCDSKRTTVEVLALLREISPDQRKPPTGSPCVRLALWGNYADGTL